MILINYFNKLKEFYFRYEKIILSVSFFTGLFWDNFTLRRLDLLYENTVFLMNLFLISLYILLINAHEAGKLRSNIFDKIVPFVPVFFQFSMGNLFSGFLIFYFRSGTIFVSWPFMLILGALFLGNEFFRKKYLHLPFQMAILFIAVFSYSVFILPVLLNKMSEIIFLLSGALALCFICLVILLLFLAIPRLIKNNLKYLALTIGSVYLVFQILYFGNIIPPIPLSIKQSGIYHSIERVNESGYIFKITYEPEEKKYLFFKDQSDIFHYSQGALAYCYSAIFSPADLNMPIFHKWMYFDEKKSAWTEYAKTSFNITGGRDKGYRGYSYAYIHKPGKWRVIIMTERGQVLGRKSFTAVKTDTTPKLETALR